MNILFAVHQFFPNHYTGSERLVLNLCKQMQRTGHRVRVLTYGITETAGFDDWGDFHIKRYHYQGVPVISVRHKDIPQLVDFSIVDEAMVALFDRILEEEKVDIVHVCHPMRVGSVIRSAYERNIPVVLTLTDFWLMCPRGIAVTQDGALCGGSEDGTKCLNDCYRGDFWKEKITSRYMQAKELLTNAGAVVSATRFLKMMFVHNRYRNDIQLIKFGKDYRNIRANSKRYTAESSICIGFLSSMNAHKGAHILLEAYQQVQPPNIMLKIYGDTVSNPDYFGILKKIARDNPNIEFCGRYDYDDMPAMLEALDMVAVPSLWWENSPLVLLRSQAHGVPAIVSNLGGMTEIITDGINGFTFDIGHSGSLPDNAADLARVLRTLSEDPSILNELQENILLPPRIEEEAFEYEMLYSSMTNRSGHPEQPDYEGAATTINRSATRQDIIAIDTEKRNNLETSFGNTICFHINAKDEMYQFLANHASIEDPVFEYFRSGRSMLDAIEEIFSDLHIDLNEINLFLDFACGYGRFSRFLAWKIPSNKIFVSDIDKNAVEFCKTSFGVQGFYSCKNPGDLHVEEKFDVIWVASLFSHLPVSLWKVWLAKLYSLLAENGLLIFSTHGLGCYEILSNDVKKGVMQEDSDFYYLKQSETNRLDVESYGTSYVSYEYVSSFIDSNGFGELISFYPKKLWNFQDIYVIRKSGSKRPDSDGD